ncbi:MAG: helix-turn-helix domain-containing protein [Pseudonocardiaceae bacterium]
MTITGGEAVMMSYGHADHLARGGQEPGDRKGPADRPPETSNADTSGGTRTPPVPPEWYARPELRPVLIGHDMATLIRALSKAGVSYRQIARLIGRSQSRVSEIATGTPVVRYDVLVDISTGLCIPPERMGLSWWGPDGTWYGPDGAYPGEVTVANTPKGVTAEMLRRHLIAWGGTILAGAPVAELGELLDDLGELPAMSLPSQLSHAHVTQVRDMTRRLGVGDTGSADSELAAAAAALATRLLDVPGPEPVTRALRIAVAELRIEAGWAAFDAGLYHHALHHYARALELATKAEDAYCQAIALGYAGQASVEHGHFEDGLKMLQCAQVAAWGIPSDDQRAVVVGESGKAAVEATMLAGSATALAMLGRHADAARALARGRDLWTPTPADPFGDPDRDAARLEIARGRLDVAEALATASLRRWEGGRQLSRTATGVVLATIHVKAEEPRGLHLAHSAITSVSRLSGVRIRRQLTPLAEALEARPGSDARELARMARQLAA